MHHKKDRPLEALLTVRQVAEALNVSDRTVRRFIALRTLEAYRIARRWRVSPSALRDFLQTARRPGGAPSSNPPWRGAVGGPDFGSRSPSSLRQEA